MARFSIFTRAGRYLVLTLLLTLLLIAIPNSKVEDAQAQPGTIVDLATGQDSPWAIDVDDIYVYWGTGDGYIRKVLKAGGAATDLATARGLYIEDIALDSTHVYWTESIDGKICRVPIAGGTVQELATGRNIPKGIDVNGMYVYWVEDEPSPNGRVCRVPIWAPGFVEVLAASQDRPWDIVFYHEYIYWSDSSATGAIRRLRIYPTIGTVENLATGLFWPYWISVGGDCIYWTSVPLNTVNKVSILGGPQQVLATGPVGQFVRGVAVYDGYSWVYWANQQSVRRVQTGGGTVIDLATGQNDAVMVAVDAANVYWTESLEGNVRTLSVAWLVGLLNFDDRNRMGSIEPTHPTNYFIFPHFHMDPNWQTYIALANPSTATANIWVTAFSDTGTVLSRRTFSLSPLNKWGGLVSDPAVLGVTGTGWIYVEPAAGPSGSDIQIVGLLNFDDYGNRMGSMSGVHEARSIYFPHFHQDANWQTYIALVNPGLGAATATLTAYSNTGVVLGTRITVINPWSKFEGLVNQIFSGLTGSGWIEVTSNNPIAGMLNFDDYGNRMGSIEHAIPTTTLYVPHFHMDSSWETFIALANPSLTSTASITINIYNDNGVVLRTNITSLAARHKIGGLVNSLFPGITGTGWVKAESDIPIIGLVNFDDYLRRMGSVLATQPLSEITYPHFHMDGSWQTFYATVNIGPSATLNATYYRGDGSIISSVQKTLATNNKRGQFTASGAGWLHIV